MTLDSGPLAAYRGSTSRQPGALRHTPAPRSTSRSLRRHPVPSSPCGGRRRGAAAPCRRRRPSATPPTPPEDRMRYRLVRTFSLLAVLLLAAVPRLAAQDTGTLSGTVTDAVTSRPMAGGGGGGGGAARRRGGRPPPPAPGGQPVARARARDQTPGGPGGGGGGGPA